MICLQLVSFFTAPYFLVSSSVSLDDVDHPSTVNFDQSLIRLVFLYMLLISLYRDRRDI